MYRRKCGESKDFVNQGGLSRKAIFSAVDASLKRMDIEYIDLLQIHRFDPNTPIEETMEALHDLVKAGKVHYIGASSMWVSGRRDIIFPPHPRLREAAPQAWGALHRATLV
jgi:aryl-alcohol dehydrogenase-like predicted oxidoreductase